MKHSKLRDFAFFALGGASVACAWALYKGGENSIQRHSLSNTMSHAPKAIGEAAVNDAYISNRQDSAGADFVHVALSSKMEKCTDVRETCIVDGDTFWLNGTKIRIADIDAPETHEPKCSYERDLGLQATSRLIDLLNAGEFDLRSDKAKPVDRYGRKLYVVSRQGHSIGEILVTAGLARPWRGHREPWCQQIR